MQTFLSGIAVKCQGRPGRLLVNTEIKCKLQKFQGQLERWVIDADDIVANSFLERRRKVEGLCNSGLGVRHDFFDASVSVAFIGSRDGTVAFLADCGIEQVTDALNVAIGKSLGECSVAVGKDLPASFGVAGHLGHFKGMDAIGARHWTVATDFALF